MRVMIYCGMPTSMDWVVDMLDGLDVEIFRMGLKTRRGPARAPSTHQNLLRTI